LNVTAPMTYRPLGATGVQVSSVALGTMTFGGGATIGGLDAAAADTLVGMALEAGVNLFDTADAYSGGEAERLLGRALAGRRSEVLLASKARLATGRRGVNDVGLSRHHLLSAVKASLERLGTDYLDVYQLHIVDHATPLHETLRAMEDLVRWGMVRYVGVCNYPAWQVMKGLSIADRHDWSRTALVQMHYSLVARDVEREIVPLVREESLGMLVWSPLSGGLLSGKFDAPGEGPQGSRRSTFDFPPVDHERLARLLPVLRDVAAEHDATPARVALAWLLHQEVVSSVILGARRPDQLADNLAAVALSLSAEQLARLNAASALPPEYPGWMIDHRWDHRMPPLSAERSPAAPAERMP
jgi:aryl-alcohol dehydrogenase-like predicted oxidoreductase